LRVGEGEGASVTGSFLSSHSWAHVERGSRKGGKKKRGKREGAREEGEAGY